MKKIHLSNLVLYLLFVQILIVSCKKDAKIDNPIIQKINEASVANKFVWNGLHDYYLWVANVPNLSAAKYGNKDTLNKFLNKYSDPEQLFYSLLYQYKKIDKWSFIVDDLQTITDWISGTSKTAGYDFMLYRYGNGNNLFGVVRYVLKGSPANLAGMKRGNIFTKVNNTQLTVSNYQSLLFNSDSYKLTFDTIINYTLTPLNRSLDLTTVELQEDPILLDTVLTVNGAKTGYLVYNGFNADFDMELHGVFQDFKNQGITRLILDLRYNGGGSVQTATYLASMIYSTDKNKVFIKSQYNSLLQDYYTQNYGASSLSDNFTDKIEKTASDPETPISSLNLNKLYVITSDNTASASELLINGLKPYMSVFSVGDSTTGKYVGSVTIQDWDDQGNVNPNDPWAMQPIVVKIANSQGVSDYVDGLLPDYYIEEDIAALLPFGDQNEPLLKAVLNDIKGLPQKSLPLKSAAIGARKVAGLRDFKPFSNDMYIKKLKVTNSLKPQ